MGMTTRLFSRLLLGVIGAVALSAPVSTSAVAQADMCRQYQAELANLERGGGGQNYAALADQQRREINRMVGYYQSLGCDRGRGVLFGAPPAPECVAARERIEVMESNYNRLLQQASQASEERRRALLAAIERNCVVERRPRTFLESIFGSPEPYVDPRGPAPFEEPERRAGGGKPVCVRLCDGYFFPLATTGGNRQAAQQMCQAQCPAAETRLFFMPGDSEIEHAAAADGTPYTSLANAFRYRTTFDPTCGCRQDGQSWVDALQGAEQMLGSRGDVIVSAEMARELSLPRDAREAARAAASRSEAEREASAEPPVAPDQTPRPRGPVRIVAPELVPPPNPM